jgi:DNA-binding response OmpR family regulator
MPPQPEILIIEDDPDTIQLLQVVMKTGNLSPVTALGGKPGLKQLQASNPDLILLDLMMDDVDGWTVLRTIRANSRWDSIPIIILSVRNPLEDPRRMKDHAGMFADYVVKPFNVRDLLGRIQRALAGEINPVFQRHDVGR